MECPWERQAHEYQADGSWNGNDGAACKILRAGKQAYKKPYHRGKQGNRNGGIWHYGSGCRLDPGEKLQPGQCIGGIGVKRHKRQQEACAGRQEQRRSQPQRIARHGWIIAQKNTRFLALNPAPQCKASEYPPPRPV